MECDADLLGFEAVLREIGQVLWPEVWTCLREPLPLLWSQSNLTKAYRTVIMSHVRRQ